MKNYTYKIHVEKSPFPGQFLVTASGGSKHKTVKKLIVANSKDQAAKRFVEIQDMIYESKFGKFEKKMPGVRKL